MENVSKLLTISIPTWNRAALVKELLIELINQILKDNLTEDIEIVVSNNGSEDNTHEVIEKFLNKYPFIRYNRNTFNIGGNPNVMKSMQMASSEYLILVGDDDRLNEGSLKKIIDFLKISPDSGIIIDSSKFKKNEINREISLIDLLEKYYWNMGNAGVFITRSSFVKDNLTKYRAGFFNENWSQTQFMILGLYEEKSRKAYLQNLDIISHSLHNDFTMYNSFYLWRGTYLELFRAIKSLESYVDDQTFNAARKYLKNSIFQVSFNILQCGVFIDSKEIRLKTRKHIQEYVHLFSFYEKIFLSCIVIMLVIPVSAARFFSNFFIFIRKGKKGLSKKNEFVNREKNKILKAELNSLAIRKLEFEADNY